jgi:ceramide glucosyltransferase
MLEALLLVLCGTAMWYYGYAIAAAMKFFSQPADVQPDFHPPISILKPIHGLDREAYANLASFCRQDYPQYELLCGVPDAQDPGAEVVRRVIRDFPDVDIHLVVGQRPCGVNPKVGILAAAACQARYPTLLIADSDIRVGPDYLRQVVQPLRQPAVGVVTCPYRSRARGGAATLDALGAATEFHAGVLVAQRLEGMRFALGSTVVITRQALDAIGGFAPLADHLADDFLLGHLAARAGYRVVLCPYVVEHVLPAEGFGEFVRRQRRWAIGQRHSRPWGHVGLLFTHGTAMSLAFLLASGGAAIGWAVVGVTWLARLAMGWIIGAKYLRDATARRFLWLIPLRDLIGFALWCSSFVGNTVDWRGQRFRVVKGGRLLPVRRPAGPTGR